MENYRGDNWVFKLAGEVMQVVEDMEVIVSSKQYPVVVLLRGYDLLEKLEDWESVQFNLQQTVCGEREKFYSALEEFKEKYMTCRDILHQVLDEKEIKAKTDAYLEPWNRKYARAQDEFLKAEKLWQMAVVAHKAQEEGSFFEKWKTLRQVRRMAGFRLERKRTGNFVARTFDLMQQSQLALRTAQLEMYGHNVGYKCSPLVYMKLYGIIMEKYM